MSVWSAKTTLPAFPTLEGNIKTDILVIGGGMAGILCAHMLSESGVDCVLLEADKIGGGVTKNTTAKITSQHGFIYNGLIKDFGIQKALMYLKANENALEKYRTLCQNIDCGFENKDNIVYSVDDPKKVEKELNALAKLGYNAEYNNRIPLPIKISGAVRFKNQAQFNPLAFIAAIVPGLNIYENSRVYEVRDNCAFTNKGTVIAKKIIVATHFPFINKFGAYFMKMYQDRSYVIALENGPNIDGMYVDEKPKGMSFRNFENLLLVGGGDHRTGKQGGDFSEIRSFAKTHYPSCREILAWATQDCMSLDGIPYIGKYSKNTSDLYVATGFNKWGMTSSMVAATILCDMVLGKQNDFAAVFSPSRSVITPQLAINAGETVAGLLSLTKKRCPHLGCALKWNSSEHSWDCPCHGSRFKENGVLLDGPATGNIGHKV
ncbi:MAG: FAD-dependent oxidoreductase [Oscillospiraceae bacterium]|nr:FAD-dependent oxidoreductase [Oscillospiraceae bacterium]